MSELRVRNWDRWQSYRKDRGQPPWIKVHRHLMRDPNFVALTDAQRGHLMCLWILAADRDGELPSDPAVLRKLCYLDSEPDTETLVSLGFLEMASRRRQHDVTATPERGAVVRLEAETEAETEAEADARAPSSVVRALYGWKGSEGTDPLLLKAFPSDVVARDLCLEIAHARMLSEGREYQGRFFRRILEAVVEEQTGESPRRRRGPVFPEASSA